MQYGTTEDFNEGKKEAHDQIRVSNMHCGFNIENIIWSKTRGSDDR